MLLLKETTDSEREALLLENAPSSKGSTWLSTLALLFAGVCPFPCRRGISSHNDYQMYGNR